MKISKKQLHSQRIRLDNKLKKTAQISSFEVPRRGWLKAIRESLGISTRQLAQILNTKNSSILRVEERELKKTVTLEVLERAARAMGCRLIYAIIPEEEVGLEEILDKRARKAAEKIYKNVTHTMELEAQGVVSEETERQIKKIAKNLKEKLAPQIWEDN